MRPETEKKKLNRYIKPMKVTRWVRMHEADAQGIDKWGKKKGFKTASDFIRYCIKQEIGRLEAELAPKDTHPEAP